MVFIIAAGILVTGWFCLLRASKVRRRRWLAGRSAHDGLTPTTDTGPSSDFGNDGFDDGGCSDDGGDGGGGDDSSCD